MRTMSSKARDSTGACGRAYNVRKMRTTSSFTHTGSVVLIRLVTSKSLRRKFMRAPVQLLWLSGHFDSCPAPLQWAIGTHLHPCRKWDYCVRNPPEDPAHGHHD